MAAPATSIRLFASLVATLAAAAYVAGSAASEIALGDVPRFRDEAEARASCGSDPVVWADSKSGFFFPKFHPDYGRTAHGAYTCYGLAKKADYWSLVPEGDSGREGREFPLIFCAGCS